MITRNTRSVDEASLPPKIREARRVLRKRGWTYRAASAALGVSYTHFALVMTGKRESRRLLAAIHALPNRNA